MSTHDVKFEDVRRRIAEFGDRAALISITDHNTPHVVSAVVTIDNDRLLARVGPRTNANLQSRPTITLLWVPPAGGEYQMILDCAADSVGDPGPDGVSAISIAVTGGILHRLSDLPGDGPSCIVLGG